MIPKVYIGYERFSFDELLRSIKVEEDIGSLITFSGIARNAKEDNGVVKLIYEAYESMALKEAIKIREVALKTFLVKDIYIYHFLGEIKLKEPSFFVITLSSHRKEGFAATEFVIDEFKKIVPIWKKEIFENNNERWVIPNE